MLSNDTEILSTSLQNCVPYTTYIVTMKAKLNSSLIWSEVAEKVVKTKSDGICIFFFIHTSNFLPSFCILILGNKTYLNFKTCTKHFSRLKIKIFFFFILVPYHRPNTSQGLYTINNITSKTQGFTLFYKVIILFFDTH